MQLIEYIGKGILYIDLKYIENVSFDCKLLLASQLILYNCLLLLQWEIDIITDRIGDKQNVYKQFSLHPEPSNLRVPLAVHKERIQLNYKPNL